MYVLYKDGSYIGSSTNLRSLDNEVRRRHPLSSPNWVFNGDGSMRCSYVLSEKYNPYTESYSVVAIQYAVYEVYSMKDLMELTETMSTIWGIPERMS